MRMADPLGDDGHGGDDAERTVRELVRALDAEIDALEPSTVARLAHVRLEALEHGSRERDRSRRPFAGPDRPRLALAGTAAVAALAAILVAAPVPNEPPVPPTVAGPAALEVLPALSGVEELEFYESVDFLLWLEARRA